MARTATASLPNFLVDLEPGHTEPVVVSLTYRASQAGKVQQWDGQQYHTMADLPATVDEAGREVWMRTSFVLDSSHPFDYQSSVPGVNVLFQVTNLPSIHRLEASPVVP